MLWIVRRSTIRIRTIAAVAAVNRLDDGVYLLTIEATLGQYTARRGVRFTVG